MAKGRGIDCDWRTEREDVRLLHWQMQRRKQMEQQGEEGVVVSVLLKAAARVKPLPGSRPCAVLG